VGGDGTPYLINQARQEKEGFLTSTGPSAIFHAQSYAKNTMQYMCSLFSILLIPALCRAQSNESAKKTDPVATVDGQAITEDDLAPLVQGQLRPLRDQEYQIKKKALESLISQKVLEAEAKKKGLTADKLLEQEVDSKIPEPRDVEINAVYAVHVRPPTIRETPGCFGIHSLRSSTHSFAL